MKYSKLIISVIFAIILLGGCSDTKSDTVVVQTNSREENSNLNGKSDGSEEEITTRENLGDPVETNPPETSYEPAFEGQTRISSVKTESDYGYEVIASGLDSPWAIAVLPNGDFAITEKSGTLRLLSEEGELSEKIEGFLQVDFSGQGGLLDVKASADFEDSQILYFTFSEPSDEGTLTAVGKGRLSIDKKEIEDFQVIYRALPYYNGNGHYGSRIAEDSKGNLFISTGDRVDESNRMRVQELDNGHGKVIHITAEGEPVEGGPFANTEGANPEIYSYGHRNIQGLDIHPQTGELWASEMGPRGGDELNLILPGKNYGWPLVSFGIEYSGEKVGEGQVQRENTQLPVYYWDPVLAPSGMTFYNSDEIPEWKNNLFIGGLRSQHIARIILKEDKVVGEERLLEELGERFRDLEQGADGSLYAITDSGNVYRVGKK